MASTSRAARWSSNRRSARVSCAPAPRPVPVPVLVPVPVPVRGCSAAALEPHSLEPPSTAASSAASSFATHARSACRRSRLCRPPSVAPAVMPAA